MTATFTADMRRQCRCGHHTWVDRDLYAWTCRGCGAVCDLRWRSPNYVHAQRCAVCGAVHPDGVHHADAVRDALRWHPARADMAGRSMTSHLHHAPPEVIAAWNLDVDLALARFSAWED